MKTDWLRVNRTRRCVICGKPDWCTFTVDGKTACCMRVESNQHMKNGGWAHQLVTSSVPMPPRHHPRPPHAQSRRPTCDWAEMMARWRGQTSPGALEGVAARLCLRLSALKAMETAFAKEHGAWAFPMRNGARQVVGIRLRADNGRKWAVRGSHNGLFWPQDVPGDLCDTVYICEGPTDTAALLGLDLSPIGRPSCSGGVDLMKAALHAIGRRDIIIVSDSDTPGRVGARCLAEAILHLARSVRIIEPINGKDVRDWASRGATGAVIECVARNAEVICG